jgi:VanZ family protein
MASAATRLWQHIWLWGPVAVIAGGIFMLSNMSGGADLPSFPHIDKLAHIIVFGLLGLTVVRAFSRLLSWRPMQVSLLSIVVVTAYGASDELHQHFIPQRTVELLDVGADAIGVTLACLVWFLMIQRSRGVE